MGGLDIFKSVKRGETWTAPVNLEVPVNSSSDDFAMIFQPGEDQGFFSPKAVKVAMISILSLILHWCLHFRELLKTTVPFSYSAYGPG